MPMPGNGAKHGLAAPPAPADSPATMEVDIDPAPPSTELPPAPPEGESKSVLSDAPDSTFVPPPKPKTAGRPGAPIQFSAAAVQGMIRDLEACVSPTVTFSEDVAKMRAEAHKKSADGLQRVLAALKFPR